MLYTAHLLLPLLSYLSSITINTALNNNTKNIIPFNQIGPCMPPEIMGIIMTHLSANSNINLARTCQTYYQILLKDNPQHILCRSIPLEKHFYLKALVFYGNGKRSDRESLQLLVDNENEENRLSRENLLRYFNPKNDKNIDEIIDICEYPNKTEPWRGDSALHQAVFYENIEVMDILLNYLDIDSTQKNANGTRVIDMIFKQDYKGGINLRKDMINLFLNHPQCQPNQCDWFDEPILCTMVFNNRIDDVKLLLENSKIDPNTISKQDYTALHYALKHKHTEIAKLLINDPRTNLNIKYNDNYYHHNETFLMFAIECIRETDIITHLASDPRCDPNLQDNNGDTALHHAARYPLAAKALLETSYHPINLNIKNKKCETTVDQIKTYASHTRYDHELYKTILQIISEYQKKNSDLQKNNSIIYAKYPISLYNTLLHIFQMMKNMLTIVFTPCLY